MSIYDKKTINIHKKSNMNHFLFSKKNVLAAAAAAGSLSLVCILGTVLAAWNDPNSFPPNDNVEAPINVSSSSQTKAGNFSVGGGLDYWITKDGDSFVLQNDAGADKLIIGQDGNMTVNGRIKITGGSPGNNKVLVSDINGLAAWQALPVTLPAGASGQTLRHDGTGWIGSVVLYNDGTNIGIGTSAPGSKLEVAGQIKITGGTPGLNKLLVSDASGLASWKTAADVGISGSLPAGANGQTLRHNGTDWIANSVISNDGTNVGIGTNSPAGKLDINSADALFVLGQNVLSHVFAGSTYLKAPSGQTIAFQIPSGTTVASIDSTGISAPAFYYTSDRRLKNNIRPIAESLAKIQELDGVYFNWVADQSPSIGLIAQDVEKIFPEAVATNPETGLKSIDYGKLIAPLIEAVKTQQSQIQELKQEIDDLKNSANCQ